jgi:citrate lyase subunit beta/citryl-CoA lyase
VPLLESAASVLNAVAIARAPRVQRLQIGEADLRADMGVTPGDDERELLYVRSHVVLASTAAGIAPPIAPVSTNFRDLDAFRASTEALARLGFVGRACIHPAQVAIANEVFTPSEEQVNSSRALVEKWERDGAGVAVDDRGQFVDEAVIRQARLVLARAR